MIAASSIGVAVMPAIAFYVLIAFATSVPGGVLVIQIAWSLYAVCTSLGARAITTAVLPTLSAAAARDDRDGFAAGWRQALAYTIIVGLPLMCLLVAAANPTAGTAGPAKGRAAPARTRRLTGGGRPDTPGGALPPPFHAGPPP